MSVRRTLAGVAATAAVAAATTIGSAAPSGAAPDPAELGRVTFADNLIYVDQRLEVSWTVLHDADQTITCQVVDWGDGTRTVGPPEETTATVGAERERQSRCRFRHRYELPPEPQPFFGSHTGAPGGSYQVRIDAKDQDGTSATSRKRRLVTVCHNDRPLLGERVVGSERGDTLCGGPHADEVFGRGGADLLYGFDGRDELDGGEGGDVVLAGVGSDALSGDVGADALIGMADHDTIDGGGGRDIVGGMAGDDELEGGPDADTMVDPRGSDRMLGQAGADLIFSCDQGSALGRPDVVGGGAGNDSALADAQDRVTGIEDHQLCGPGGAPAVSARTALPARR